MTYEKGRFIVKKNDGSTRIFTRMNERLYGSLMKDPRAMSDKQNMETTLIETVDEKNPMYTKRAYFGAVVARKLQNMIGYSDGVMGFMSPREMITGKKVDYDKYWNDMEERALSAIAMHASGNMQGGCYFMSLNTGRRSHRTHWDDLPVPKKVIERVYEFANKGNTGDGLTTAWRDGTEIAESLKELEHYEEENDDDYVYIEEYEYDEDYYYNEDELNEEAADLAEHDYYDEDPREDEELIYDHDEEESQAHEQTNIDIPRITGADVSAVYNKGENEDNALGLPGLVSQTENNDDEGDEIEDDADRSESNDNPSVPLRGSIRGQVPKKATLWI